MNELNLNSRQKKLFDLAARLHGDQVRKYTGEPYLNHLREVGSILHAEGYNFPLIEIAILHDVLEDTDCDYEHLVYFVEQCGYELPEAVRICTSVEELTDEFTTEAVPMLNRTARKFMEAKRLGNISTASQTVKYADIISNAHSIFQHDQKFAKVYGNECIVMLDMMRGGDHKLRTRAYQVINNYRQILNP